MPPEVHVGDFSDWEHVPSCGHVRLRHTFGRALVSLEDIGYWNVWVGPQFQCDGRELTVRDAKITAEKKLRFAIAQYELQRQRMQRKGS